MNKHGGARHGAGRKKKYGEETLIVSFRCPKSMVKEIKLLIIEWLINKNSLK